MTSESTATKIPAPAILMIILIGGSFAADSFMRFPVPGTNEPHYLTKARHYWNPQWCADDFFLESSNAHLFFFQTVGAVTQVLTLPLTAVLGRFAGFLLLAIGWYRLINILCPGFWAPLITAWFYLALAAIGNFSGEWIIGGIESKVFAYGFLFLALANACEQNWNRAGIYAGLTITWHPVVGVWSLACSLFALVCLAFFNRKSLDRKTLVHSLKAAIPALGCLLLCSLPGLVPSLALLMQGDPKDSFAANFIQVFYRLKHHLDPMDFDLFSYLMYAILLVTWLFLARKESPSFTSRFFQFFIIGTVGLACIGILLGAGPRPASEMPYYAFRMSLLKFYPFRLFDALLPLAFSVAIFHLIQQYLHVDSEQKTTPAWLTPALRKTILAVLCLGIFSGTLYSAWNHPPIHKMTPAQRADWIDACEWIRDHTPEESIFLTPAHATDFKWYAQRPEYVTYKDCPQDASGIVEWNRRLKYLRKWGQEYYNEGFDDRALQALQQKTGITYLLVKRLGPFTTIDPIYQNRTYKVYQLP